MIEMKTATFLLLQFAGRAAFAASPPFANFCDPFNGNASEVLWEASTNPPASVKIFSVVPTKFSASTISNLLQLAELKPDQRKRVNQTGVFAGKDVRFFADKKETRQLNFVPSEGFIALNKTGVIAEIPRQMPVGVPDDKEALRLALDILQKIGISQSELATNLDGKIHLAYSEDGILHKDKPSGLLITNVVGREIKLTRQIEGIPVWGGGVSAKFGNEGKLAYLSATWRTIKQQAVWPVPTATDFMARIKSGRVFIRSEQAGLSFGKLTVKKVQLYYWENDASEHQSTIYPFAVLEAESDLPGENSTAQLFVPLANE